MQENGDWCVSIDDEVSDHVRLQFVEMDEQGANETIIYMPPSIARNFANAVLENCDYLESS